MSDNTLTRENQFYAEIAALRAEVATVTRGLKAKVAELAQRTAERDEARRDACEFEAILCFNLRIPRPWSVNQESARIAREIAAERGWDCFTAHANTTDVPVQDGGAA